MTLVAACRFWDGAVVIADSRATWEGGGVNQKVEDTLRKILHIGPRIALAYAGSVEVAQCVAKELRQRVHRGGRKAQLRKLALDLPRIARRCFSLSKRRTQTQFVLVGADGGKVLLWCAESPQFSTKKVAYGPVVMGSGAEVVKPMLDAGFAEIEASCPTLKNRADHLRDLLERELRKGGERTVGGLFQVITVESDGIRPMTYGFTSMDPESTAPSLSMGFAQGTWVQRIEATGAEVPVADPEAVIRRGPSGIVVQDLLPPGETDQKGIWRLCYFIPCLAGSRDRNAIEFRGEVTVVGPKRYPIEFQIIAAIGFWGSPGKHQFVIRLNRGDRTDLLLESTVKVPYPIEVVDVVTRVHLAAAESGAAFLECLMDGQLLGRRALYFGEPSPSLGCRDRAAVERASKKQVEEMSTRVDPYLDTHVASLAYWSVCRNALYERGFLRFEHETQAVYWKNYPLLFRTSFAAGFRTRPGTHRVKVDLVHAMSRAVTPGETAAVQSESSMEMHRVHGETIVKIPEPGWYFFNLSVDDVLVGSSMICAETDKARFSYGLLPQDTARVGAGELLVLGRRVPSVHELQASESSK